MAGLGTLPSLSDELGAILVVVGVVCKEDERVPSWNVEEVGIESEEVETKRAL